MNIIAELEAAQAAKLLAGKTIPSFQPGDTVVIVAATAVGSFPEALILVLVVIVSASPWTIFAVSTAAAAVWKISPSAAPR